MNQLQLTKPWAEFKVELDVLINDGKALRNMPTDTAEAVNEMEVAIDVWDEHVKQWLQNSFNISRNTYLIAFHNAGANNFNIPNQNMSRDQQLVLLKGRIQTRMDTLFFLGRILSVSDAVVRPETVNFEERSNMTIKQKKEFILNKLYELYDDLRYPLVDILQGNAVVLKRSGEAGEIATMLEDAGYIDQTAYLGGAVNVRLTAEGAQLIEERLEAVTENYNDIPSTYAEMAAKIEEVKEELRRTNMGHEILYNELQELKELYVTLNKKSWGQLLKGKLFDVALGKLVDNATIAFVYEAITDHKLKLLS